MLIQFYDYRAGSNQIRPKQSPRAACKPRPRRGLIKTKDSRLNAQMKIFTLMKQAARKKNIGSQFLTIINRANRTG